MYVQDTVTSIPSSSSIDTLTVITVVLKQKLQSLVTCCFCCTKKILLIDLSNEIRTIVV